MVLHGPVLVLFLALLAPLVGPVQAHNRPFPVVDKDYCQYLLESGRGFLFQDSLPGDGKRPMVTAFADAAGRRTWSEGERRFMERWLRLLAAKVELRSFFARIHWQGSRHFYRLGAGIGRSTAGVTRPVLAHFVYEFETHNYQAGVTFFDLFFQPLEQASPQEDEEAKVSYLLHELAHAYDGPGFDYSMSDEFLRLMGWASLAMTQAEVESHLERLNLMRLAGQAREAREEGRRLGRALGLPRLYGAYSPQECFAVLMEAIVLDPQAPTYIAPKIIAWFRKNVLR